MIPGLGHVYVGQTWKGALYFAGVFGLGFLGLDLDLTGIGAVVGIPMDLGGVGLWIHNIVDAYRQAARLSGRA